MLISPGFPRALRSAFQGHSFCVHHFAICFSPFGDQKIPLLSWNWEFAINTYTPAIFKVDNQQGPAECNRELCSILCHSLNGKRIWKRIVTYMCRAESLCCTPETNITLLINCFVVVVQSLSCVRLFVTLWTAACQASLSFTISWSLLKFMSTELVMLSNHLILCHPLLQLCSHKEEKLKMK